ncbi:MAG: putative system, mannose subunit [Firmicutes bacterium]|nr:putative system, mannose subunit [Bacillota bacterium]
MAAIVIGTHGKLAEALLASCEMICGPRENIAAVTLEPGEGVDGLVGKYKNALSTLDRNNGVLFITDLFGGSPYNAACRIALSEENISIVAGANLPMLLEVTSQPKDIQAKAALELAQSSGMQGIQVFKEVVTNEEEEL